MTTFLFLKMCPRQKVKKKKRHQDFKTQMFELKLYFLERTQKYDNTKRGSFFCPFFIVQALLIYIPQILK